MRASKWLCLPVALSATALAGSGCSKEVKADFPRPPVTASIKTPPSEAPDETPEAVPEPSPPETASDPEPVPSPEPPSKEPPPPRPRPAVESAKNPSPPVEPPSTQLSSAPSVDPALTAKMDRASSLLGAIGLRELTELQAEQLTAARAFVSQARRALEEGDPRRALVLIDKGLILAEDVERLSRP